MSYATSDDLIARFGQAQLLLLADRDNDGELDDDVIAPAIVDAGDIVDLSLRGLYALPLSPVPSVIVGITCDLTRTRLYGQSTEVPESVLAADRAARSLLAQIASGAVTLDAAPAPETSEGTGLDVETAGDAPVFTFDKLKGF